MEENNEKFLAMQKELENKNKIIWKSMWIIMWASMIAMFAFIFVAIFLVPAEIWKLIIIICSVIMFLLPCFYALKLEVSVGVYKCKKCGCEVTPTYNQALRAMHMGTTRYLKCPNCNKRNWCKKEINKNQNEN